jgi:NitT/TauT family transport system substrate-binding protein
MLQRTLLLALALIVGTAASLASPQARAQEATVLVGMVRSISSVATITAIEKGYFKEAGIKVVTEDLDTSANNIALLAQNRLQIIQGGISAGYFNALEKDLPIVITMDRVSSPLGHNLMLRPDLKDKITAISELKGKTVASNGAGSVSTYELGKMLEGDGVTIADVDVKVLPFTQMALAFANKAVDAAIVIPPFTSLFLSRGDAVAFKDPDDLVRPHPLTIAVDMINTDWAKGNADLVRNYYVAYLRGVREYCQAYHGGPNRAEIIERAMHSGAETRRELLYDYPWPARSPDGHVNVESMLDMQAWYVKNKFSTAHLPPSRLVDTSYVDYAVRKLGPFELANKASQLPGCR